MRKPEGISTKAVRLLARTKALMLVGVLGTLITLVFAATLDRAQGSEPASAMARSGATAATAAGETTAVRQAPTETLLLALLGSMLLCVAAGIRALAPSGGEGDRAGEARTVVDGLDTPAAVRTASATSTTS